MTAAYVARRVGTFLLIIWLAATLNFFLPRIGGENPIAQKLMQMAALGGNLHAGIPDMIKEYQAKFGFDKSLDDAIPQLPARHDRVQFQLLDHQLSGAGLVDMIAQGLPWTVTLMTVTTLLAFVDRQRARRVAGLARRAALAALHHAAAAGDGRGAVLPARPDPDLRGRLPAATAAAVRRLHAPARSRTGAFRSHSTWPRTRSCRASPSSSVRSASGRWACAR